MSEVKHIDWVLTKNQTALDDGEPYRDLEVAALALVAFLRGCNDLNSRGAGIELSRLCRNVDAGVAALAKVEGK